MVAKCLNPACRAPFTHDQDGRFIYVDRLLSHSNDKTSELCAEEYWLCGSCSKVLKVVVENGSILTLPIDSECKTLVG